MSELLLKAVGKDEGAGTSAGGGRDGEEDGEGLPDLKLQLPARKRRIIDVLQETLAVGSSEDEEGDLVLDWRAKGV